jgi:hypothetical protein
MTTSQLKVLKEGTPINVIHDGELHKMYFVCFLGIDVIVSTDKNSIFGTFFSVSPSNIIQLSSLELELL